MSSPRSEHPKSSKPTKQPSVKQTGLLRKHYGKLAWLALYIVVVLLASYLFYRRFPNNFKQPNFYAEDGYAFGNSIIHKGFFGSLLTTFNGYYIWGIYILEKLGFMFNSLRYGGQFTDLPQSFALVSYAFLGFVTTLPLFLFRKYFKLQVLVLICLMSIFVPLLGYDYAIIGTIGNLKFAFAYIAFLLLVYRSLISEDSKAFYAVDIGLLVCAYTDITVYPMMIFALARYAKLIRFNKSSLKTLVRSRSFQSLVVLGLAMLPQLLVVAHSGVPAMHGYLDSPYQMSKTVEIFISRSYLFAVLFPLNKHLNDGLVIASMLVFLAGGWYVLRGYRRIFVFGLYAIFLATFLFVVKRTGVSALFLGYKTSGPDQFFYAQNWMFIFIFGLFLGELLGKLKSGPGRFVIYLGIFLLVFMVYVPKAGMYGKNDFMADSVGTVFTDAHSVCVKYPNRQTLNLPIYPAPSLSYQGIPRSTLCTKDVLSYQPPDVSLGLVTYKNNYVQLDGGAKFTQTFVSPRDGLDGLNIYFSTFGAQVHSPYKLLLMDAKCQNTIRSVKIPVGGINDNSFFTVNFKPVAGSSNQTYCFSVRSTGTYPSPLAVQLSSPNAYPAGKTTLDSISSNKAIVFSLHYKD
jgi:hypothetical protein